MTADTGSCLINRINDFLQAFYILKATFKKNHEKLNFSFYIKCTVWCNISGSYTSVYNMNTQNHFYSDLLKVQFNAKNFDTCSHKNVNIKMKNKIMIKEKKNIKKSKISANKICII